MKKILEILIDGVFDLLYYLRLVKALKLRAIDIRMFAKLVAIRRIQYQFDFSLPGDDELRDSRLYSVVDAFFRYDAKAQTVIDEGESTEILRWLENDPVSKEDRKIYLCISHWLAGENKKENEAQIISSIYQSLYGKHPEPLDRTNIMKIWSRFKKRFKSETKIFRESKTQRYDLRLERLTPLLPWFSVFFIFAGYTYTYSVYSHFGVDVSKFFSISDYLAVSIEEITSCSGIFVGLMIAALREYRDETAWTKYELQNPSIRPVLNYWIRYISCLGYLYMMYVGIIPLGIAEFLGPITIIYVVQFPLFLVVNRYFKNPRYLLLVFLSLVGFFSGILISSKEHIKSIEERHSDITFKLEAGAEEFTQENFSFIGGNSRYIFLHSKEGSVEIIPIEIAKRIKFSSIESAPNMENKDE